MARPKLGVLVSGSGSNLQALLDGVASGVIDADVALVISNRSGVRALARAEQAGVPSLALPHREFSSREAFDARLVEELRAKGVNWVVLAGFMRLLTGTFLDAFQDRIINVHPSLLPSFPGVNAGQQALDYGAKVTGCTVHLVTQEMDSGPIIAQAAVSIENNDTEETLMSRMHRAEHKLLVQAVKAATEGRLSVTLRGDKRAHVEVRPE